MLFRQNIVLQLYQFSVAMYYSNGEAGKMRPGPGYPSYAQRPTDRKAIFKYATYAATVMFLVSLLLTRRLYHVLVMLFCHKLFVYDKITARRLYQPAQLTIHCSEFYFSYYTV